MGLIAEPLVVVVLDRQGNIGNDDVDDDDVAAGLADSNHFVLLNGKTVSLIDLDGSNKRDLYNGELAERIALSSTDLAQVIVLTSLSPNSGSNLYGISLR